MQKYPQWPPRNFIPERANEPLPFELKPKEPTFMPTGTAEVPNSIPDLTTEPSQKSKGPSFLANRTTKMSVKSPPRKLKSAKAYLVITFFICLHIIH